MKYLIGLFFGLMSTVSFGQSGLEVILVGDGFTSNNYPAATVYNCMPNKTDCIQYTFNTKSLSTLLNGKQISNKMRNNPDLESDADFSGQHFVISNKSPSIFTVKVSQHDETAKKLTLHYNLMLVSIKGDKQIEMKDKYLTVEGEFYDTLVGILN